MSQPYHKTFTIPLIDKVLELYWGEKGWKPFFNACKKAGSNIDKDPFSSDPNKHPGGGRADGSWVWVENIRDRSLLIHEISHFLDMLYDFVGCKEEREFKAYLAEYVLDTAISFAEKQPKPRKKQ